MEKLYRLGEALKLLPSEGENKEPIGGREETEDAWGLRAVLISRNFRKVRKSRCG